MLLTELLTARRIKVPLAAGTKQEVIEELVDLLVGNGDVSDRDRVLQAVMERERTRTTGIGGGVAIPHGKCSTVQSLVAAIGKPAEPVDFESVDGKPVSLVIMLISPLDRTGPHIQALARISRLMLDEEFKNKLQNAQSAQELYDLINEKETE